MLYLAIFQQRYDQPFKRGHGRSAGIDGETEDDPGNISRHPIQRHGKAGYATGDVIQPDALIFTLWLVVEHHVPIVTDPTGRVDEERAGIEHASQCRPVKQDFAFVAVDWRVRPADQFGHELDARMLTSARQRNSRLLFFTAIAHPDRTAGQ